MENLVRAKYKIDSGITVTKHKQGDSAMWIAYLKVKNILLVTEENGD